MRKRNHTAIVLLVAAMLLTACSHKNVHMSKHRKSRKCNCPTFTERPQVKNQHPNYSIVYNDTRRGI